jgi:hypothetical protein
LKSALVLLRVRSRWQLHPKRELLHHVNGCKIGVAEALVTAVWLVVPKPIEWQQIGNQIDPASILGSALSNIALVPA